MINHGSMSSACAEWAHIWGFPASSHRNGCRESCRGKRGNNQLQLLVIDISCR